MNDFVLMQVARLVAIVALLCVAAAIATPKGRLPLALRGMAKMLARDHGTTPAPVGGDRPSLVKRVFAFVLVVFAVLLALF